MLKCVYLFFFERLRFVLVFPLKTAPFLQVAAMTLADTAQGGFSYNAQEDSYDNVQMLLSNLTFLGRQGQDVTRYKI